MASKSIHIQLTEAEAIVLFEWLTRNENAEALRYDDPAEQKVLWKLEAVLERTLVQPLAPNYSELLVKARKEVANG
ncbi:hypothetical protein WMF20_46810 [Sorangium sp. So ce834]|uniref:hypothetical protein n=1 Tax=Sorangium sp. So ce834 TaxID=3133321 RepID=UPI003F60BD14